MLNLARHYGAIAASYEITPLVKIAAYGVLNADDRSGVLWPRLEYSAAANLDSPPASSDSLAGQTANTGASAIYCTPMSAGSSEGRWGLNRQSDGPSVTFSLSSGVPQRAAATFGQRFEAARHGRKGADRCGEGGND